MSEEYWLGYLAGIIDGEGTIGVYKYKDKKGRIMYPLQVAIGMTSEKVINFLHKNYGGRITINDLPSGKRKYTLRFRAARDIRKLLKPLKLLEKEGQQELILQACKYTSTSIRPRPLWAEYKLDEIVKKSKELNR